MFGLGASTGIGLLGYSYVARNSYNLASLTSALSKVLSETQIRATAEGTVKIEPAEISLAKGQTVSLDPNARVLLDPRSMVAADGELRVQAPTISTPQPATPRSTAKVPTITNFTVFKSVGFDKGHVMTGWIFLTSAQRSPTTQYCYYTESADAPGLNISVDLGEDQVPAATKAGSGSKSFDYSAAFAKCVWFKNASP